MILFQKTGIAGLEGVEYNKSSSDISAVQKMQSEPHFKFSWQIPLRI